MITAKEARQRLVPAKNKHIVMAEKAILEAVEKNQQSCYVPVHLNDEAISSLRSLGYGIAFCCGSSTLIFW